MFFISKKDLFVEICKSYFPVLWLLLAVVVVSVVLCEREVSAHSECDCSCGQAWPCQGEGLLCPAENNQPSGPDVAHYHEGPCFCLSKDGHELVWVMEYIPDGIKIDGKKTEWGTCKVGSRTPYCRIQTSTMTVCGRALLQWLRYIDGWFDRLYQGGER